MAANASCGGENTGPGLLVVKFGTTRPSVDKVATVASAAPAPSALNETTDPCRVPTRIDRPTIPLHVKDDGRKHRVSRERLGGPGAGDHQRDDERHLDHRDRHSEHQRPVRLADTVSDDLRMMNRGEHRAREQRGDDPDDWRRKSPAPRQPQTNDGHDRDDDGPGKNG